MSAAAHAVRAAKNYRRWGCYAAVRYVLKHGADIGLYFAACNFEARRQS